MWVVDTCVLIDLLRRDEAFATLSADALDAKRAEGLTIVPLTYVELAPALGGDVRAQDYFLSENSFAPARSAAASIMAS